MRGQEKSLDLWCIYEYLYFKRLFLLSIQSMHGIFHPKNVRASLLLLVQSGIKLLALNWVSPKMHSYTLSAHPNTQQLESKTRFRKSAIFTVIK